MMAMLGSLRDRLPARAEFWQCSAKMMVAIFPGIVVAFLLALVAGWIAGGLGEPLSRNPVLVAMVFGLLIGNSFPCPDRFRPGLDFTKRYLLRLALSRRGRGCLARRQRCDQAVRDQRRQQKADKQKGR
jgi:hypothetical protein